jgi:hypothetical protein
MGYFGGGFNGKLEMENGKLFHLLNLSPPSRNLLPLMYGYIGKEIVIF